MGQYIVRTGDCFASIAAQWGLDVDGLAALGNNDRYRAEGRSAHTLRPGDVVEVPDQPPNRSTKFSAGNEKRRRYRVPVPNVRFRIRAMSRAGQALGDKKFELTVTGVAAPFEGRTNGEGWLEAQIPANATQGVLKVWLDDDKDPYEFRLAIGGLSDAQHNAGIAQRLHNLGLGLAAGEEGLHQALFAFQRREGLTANGQLDDDTRTRIETRGRGA